MAETLFAEVPEEAGVDEFYRPLSGLAVAGFAVSWLSAAALFGAILWSVAALAIVLNLAALRHIAVTSRQGVALVRAGLIISVLFLSAAISSDWWHGFVTRRQAQRVADEWVAAVLGHDLPRAHQLTLAPNRRQADGEGLAEIYAKNPELQKDLRGFEQIESVNRAAHLKGENAAYWLEEMSLISDAYREAVAVRYAVRYEAEGEPQVVQSVVSIDPGAGVCAPRDRVARDDGRPPLRRHARAARPRGRGRRVRPLRPT